MFLWRNKQSYPLITSQNTLLISSAEHVLESEDVGILWFDQVEETTGLGWKTLPCHMPTLRAEPSLQQWQARVL